MLGAMTSNNHQLAWKTVCRSWLEMGWLWPWPWKGFVKAMEVMSAGKSENITLEYRLEAQSAAAAFDTSCFLCWTQLGLGRGKSWETIFLHWEFGFFLLSTLLSSQAKCFYCFFFFFNFSPVFFFLSPIEPRHDPEACTCTLRLCGRSTSTYFFLPALSV